MCGIGGIKRFRDEAITDDQIKQLVLGLENRGKDATGVAIQNDGEPEIHVCKNDMPAWSFLTTPRFADFLRDNLKPETRTVIVHCRAATQGTPRDMANNHPLYVGNSAVVHNGIINNDDVLFKEFHLDRRAEVDSDIIRAIIDKDGFDRRVARKLDRLSGSAAIAAIHKDWPNHVLLGRSISPLVLGINEDFLYWASEKHAIYKAARPMVERRGMWFQKGRPDLDWGVVEQDSLWLLGPEGLVWHDRFSTGVAGYYANRDTSSQRRNTYSYARRQERWQSRGHGSHAIGKFEIPCPNEKCPKTAIDIKKVFDGEIKPADAICPHCKTNLGLGDWDAAIFEPDTKEGKVN